MKQQELIKIISSMEERITTIEKWIMSPSYLPITTLRDNDFYQTGSGGTTDQKIKNTHYIK